MNDPGASERSAFPGSKWTAVREPMPPVIDDFIGAVGIVDVDDIDLCALLP
jgi:hypothetical protein